MNEAETISKVKLQKTQALTVFRAGQQAFAEIEGLRGIVLRGLFLNYLIFFAATIILNGLFYFQLLAPFITGCLEEVTVFGLQLEQLFCGVFNLQLQQ